MDHEPAKTPDTPAQRIVPFVEGRRRSQILLFTVAFLALLGGTVWAGRSLYRTFFQHPDETPVTHHPSDPRLSYDGPFRNIHSDVPYVGNQRCAECHLDIVTSYSQHPMGRSFFTVSQVAPQQPYDAQTHNPFEALGTSFLVQLKGERMVHKQVGRDDKGDTIYELSTPIDFVLGSGTQGHSYLTNRGGYLYQSPVSWYSQKQIWDISPGAGHPRTGRAITGRCLYCHANRANAREECINGYAKPIFDGFAIGCERCHGPAALHLQDPGKKDAISGADYTIVNPRHLTPHLRESVCEQCHLAVSGRVLPVGRGMYDYRPGLPLESFWAMFVPAAGPENKRKAVGHVEQMYRSRCFQKSEENPQTGERKLGCTSCHDPHKHVGAKQRVVYFRQKCLTCHEKKHPCSLPVNVRRRTSRDDSCIECHMPRYATSDVAHTASTDHRILREPTKQKPTDDANPTNEPDIVPFYSQKVDLNDQEAARNFAVGMIQIFSQREATPGRHVGLALRLLEEAVQRDAADYEAWEALALAYTYVKRPDDALRAYESVLMKAPRREIALARAALLAQSQNQFDKALDYFRRAIDVNPSEASYRLNLAQLLAHQERWPEARTQCAAWLELDPANIESRTLWVSCLLRTGDKAQAKAEFEKIERLRPANLPLLQARFQVEYRSR